MISRIDLSVEDRSEQERNRVLRRVDWRFLLPDPQPVKSVCFGEGLFQRGVAEFSERVIRPEEALPGECDLAAAVDPSRETIQAAYRLLRPGGVFYAEWRSLLAVLQAGGKNVARRMVEAAGLSDVRLYWPWPPPERPNPSFWLPLDAPQALAYFLRHRPRPGSTAEGIKGSLLVAAWRMGLYSQLLAPLSLVAVKSPPAGDEDKMEPRLLLTGGGHSTNKVVALVFSGREDKPHLALKYPRSIESIPAIIREKETLQAIQSMGIGSGACLPRVVDFQDRGRLSVLAETPITGQPLYTFLNQGSYRSLAVKATDWLSQLVVDRQPRPRSEWWDRIVAPALVDFERSFRPVLASDDLDRTVETLQTLDALPLACEQRDCSPWNLLIAPQGELAVLDWESAEIHGLPGLDLVYFLAYLAFFYDGAMESGKHVESYRGAKDPETFTGGVQAECERRYLEATGLTPAALHPLRLLAWLIHSRSEHRRLSGESGGQPTLDRLRGSLFYRLWRAELEAGFGPQAPGWQGKG